MEERRKFVRLYSRLKAKCWVLGTEEPLSLLSRNIGGGGISMFTKRRLPPGSVVGIEVYFLGRLAPIRFTGEVVWSGELITAGTEDALNTYETGVKFLDITPEDRDFILKYAATNLLGRKSPQT